MLYKKLFLPILSTLFLSGALTAQTLNGVTANATTKGQLRISVFSEGRYHIDKCVNDAGTYKWQNQTYIAPNAFSVPSSNENLQHLFAMKIENTYYFVRFTRIQGSGASGNFQFLSTPAATVTSSPNNAKLFTITDVAAVTSGTVQSVSKKFSSDYNGQPFSVTLKIIYDLSKPEFLQFDATIDASKITGTPNIRLAYGFDALVNGRDDGCAYILPNLNNWNGTNAGVQNLLPDQIQKLNLIAGKNDIGEGAVIGFIRIDRPFNEGYSADNYGYAAPYNMLWLTGTNQNRIQFGTYPTENVKGPDDGVGVAFNNIPAGRVTNFSTGMSFSTAIPGDLNFYWNTAASPDLTVSTGSPASLKLSYHTEAAAQVTDIGVRANLPTFLPVTGTYTSNFFNRGTQVYDLGSGGSGSYYQVTGATAAAGSTNTITIDVNTAIAGQYTVNNASFTHAAKMIVAGSPTTLTVTTEVSFADVDDVELCGGDQEHTYRVKFRGSETAAENVVVDLHYDNAANFVTGGGYNPAAVTIPAGRNYVEFKVKSVPAPAISLLPMTITLSGTDKAYASVSATGKTMNISAGPCYIHVNPHLRGWVVE